MDVDREESGGFLRGAKELAMSKNRAGDLSADRQTKICSARVDGEGEVV